MRSETRLMTQPRLNGDNSILASQNAEMAHGRTFEKSEQKERQIHHFPFFLAGL